MVTIEEVLAAYLDCRKHKRNKQSALAFEANLPRNIYNLTQELNDGSYAIGASRCFVVTKPTPRSRLERNARQAIKTGQSTTEGITSSLGLMRQSKSHHARLRVCREALRLGYVVDTRGTKVMDYANR